MQSLEKQVKNRFNISDLIKKLLNRVLKLEQGGGSGGGVTLPIGIPDVTNLQPSLNNKQDTLVSGTNIKTVNSGTLLGSGNLNLIPLSGTTVGNPVTGPIQFVSGAVAITDSDSILFMGDSKFLFNTMIGDKYQVVLNNSDIQVITLSSINPLSRGIVGENDYTQNITALDYTQKKYVDEKIDNANLITTTYANLVTLIGSNSLTIGQKYLVTDYQTRHKIDGTANLNDNNVNEPLMVIASATNNIFSQVYSPSNRFDIIFWDYANNLCEDGVTARTGKITRRIDTVKNIDTYWDFRVVQVERIGVKYLSIPADAKSIVVGKCEVTGFTYNDLKLGSDCQVITLGDNCYSMTFGTDCNSITFGAGCSSMTFGNYCYSMTFGTGCNLITFGNFCSSMTFEYSCNSITFGAGCVSMTFGASCNLITFGADCVSISFGYYCYSMTFGAGCYYNTFSNTVGNKNFTSVTAYGLSILIGTISFQTFTTQANVQNLVYDMVSPNLSLWANKIDNAGVVTRIKLV